MYNCVIFFAVLQKCKTRNHFYLSSRSSTWDQYCKTFLVVAANYERFDAKIESIFCQINLFYL